MTSNYWVMRYYNRSFQVYALSRKDSPAQAMLMVNKCQDVTMEIEYRGRKHPWKENKARTTKWQSAKRGHF